MSGEVIEHGGVKWMQDDDGTILFFDEGLGKWDLWDPDEDGRTPPKEFLAELRVPLTLERLDLSLALKLSVGAFLVAGPLWALLYTFLAVAPAWIARRGFDMFAYGVLTVTSALMHLAVGGMVAVMAIALYRALEATDSAAVASDEGG